MSHRRRRHDPRKPAGRALKAGVVVFLLALVVLVVYLTQF